MIIGPYDAETMEAEWRWEKFTIEEFTCQCGCGQVKVDTDFMDRLATARLLASTPMPVTSGYRCPEHNANISATKSRTGPHTTGHAADISATHKAAFAIQAAANSCGMTGIGLRQAGTTRFIHLDDLPESDGQPRPHVWTYNS